jgi:hypothetical protein
MIPALVLAADAVVLVEVLPEVLDVDVLELAELLLLVVLGVVDEVEEDTEVTINLA